ncbi:MAG: RagB/SusD family nutrient uptake outer membrane protein [Muribaculaceae bacterium]|nr:RagB/SusD family nutrient uptake outer membrane protein [Muribaculaceae bacterium]
MNKYFSAILLGASLVGLTACDDYLDRQPESSITPESFFSTETDLAAYSINFYNNFPNHGSVYGYRMGTFSVDNGTDNQASVDWSSMWAPGDWKTPASGGEWDFGFIRQVNYFFDNVMPKYENGEISGNITNIRQYIGEMYFFRAYAYWRRYWLLGDFPIIKSALPDDKEVLMEATVRQPRNKVARFILDDLSSAIELLPDNSNGGKQRINKATAQLFRSRVALFEGTWLKHHKGTALVPGGPGWPGDASLLGDFNIDTEINYFLTEALASAKPVADAVVNNLTENTDTPEGYGPKLEILNPYYAMYVEQNLDGFDEVLLYRQFNTTISSPVYNNINMQLIRNGGDSGWTRGLVNSFVMENGLPIYAPGSGYDENWELQGVSATLQHRDSRIRVFTKGDNSITFYDNAGNPTYWRSGWLLEGSDGVRAVTGFACKKGKSYDGEKQNEAKGDVGSIIFRATEAMLNYMEADVELHGSVDGSSDAYWRALRKRAKVNPDYNITIAATNMAEEAKGDWGAYSHGSLVSTLLYNVRRERRNELIAEQLRLDDVRRWCALDQLITTGYQIEGIRFWGSVYDVTAGVNPLNCALADGTPIDPTVDVNGGEGLMSDPAISGPYVRPYQISKLQNLVFDGYRWTRAHYLWPIAQSAFANASPDEKVENSVIYQNPGWSKVASEAPTNID